VNKIILVGGYCATGKSTFSRKLAQVLNVPCFNKDIIKEVIGEGFGFENKDVYQKNSAVTFKLMLHIAERFLQAKKILILESNFKLSESEEIKTLLEKYNCECLTFVFKGDLDVLFNRYVERDKSSERHWVHKSAEETKDSFINGHLQFGIGELAIGQTISVCATFFAEINYEELFDIARRFVSEY